MRPVRFLWSLAILLTAIPLLAARHDEPTFVRRWLNRLAATQQAPAVGVDINNSGYPLERSACLSIAMGPSAAAECGDLRVTHELPSIRTFNKVRAPTLLYNSQFAHPYPAAALALYQGATTTTPDSVEATLSLLIGGVYVQRAKGFWAGNEWPSGLASTRRVTLVYDALTYNDPTGVYTYRIEAANWYGGVRIAASPITGTMPIINRSASPFGAGWWLAGLENLVGANTSAQTIVWIGGDGSSRQYLKHWSIPNLWYTPVYERADTLKYESGSSSPWVRSDAERTRVRFDASGNHTQTIDRFGRTTTFTYSSGRLSTINLAVTGATYNFHYVSNLLDSVTAPQLTGAIKRGAKITMTSGRLTGIRNSGDTTVSFSYLSSAGNQHLMSGRTNRRGVLTAFTFDSARRLASSRIGLASPSDSIIRLLRAGEVRGLPKSGTPSSSDTGRVYTWFDGPRQDVVDTTVFVQARFGPVRRVVDPLANRTFVQHQMCYPPYPQVCGWLPVRFQSPIGSVRHIVYDARGNPTHTIDTDTLSSGTQDTTRYGWDSTFDQLTKIVPPEKDSTVFSVRVADGSRLWQQDARGSTSRVNFTYDASGIYMGLLRTSYGPVHGPSFAAGFHYDGWGNLIRTDSPKGYTTRYWRDAIGRDTLVEIPLDTTHSPAYRSIRTQYDLLDRATSRVDLAPARSGQFAFRAAPLQTWSAPAATVTVGQTFDREGNVTAIQRSVAPDTNGIGTVTTQWTYDRADRQITTVHPDGAIDSTFYLPDGLVSSTYARLGRRIWLTYDAAGRLTSKLVDSLTYPEWVHSFPSGTPWSLPRYGNGYTTPRDTTTFVYDASGNVIYAKNDHARTNRVYDIRGRLASETQRIRTWLPLGSGGDTTSHVYTLTFRYDRNGRRTRLIHPSSLAPRVSGAIKDSVMYTYTNFGALGSVTDILGNVFTFTADLDGRVDSIIYPGNVRERFTYDAESRVIHRRVTAGQHVGQPGGFAQATIYSDTMRYDPLGRKLRTGSVVKYHESISPQASITWNAYSGLDGLVRTDFESAQSIMTWLSERYIADPLGNIWASWRGGYAADSASTITGRWYFKGTTNKGRLAATRSIGAAGEVDTLQYDPQGNVAKQISFRPVGTGLVVQATARYHDPEGRLRRFARISCMLNPPNNCDYNSSLPIYAASVHEDHWYDGFGRRILLRSRRDSTCSGGSLRQDCMSTIERTVWDGSNPLYEIRYPGWDSLSSSQLERDTVLVTDNRQSYGRVAYTHGLGVDRPLNIVRMGFSATWAGPVAVTPLGDMQGIFDLGAFDDGRAKRCTSYTPDTNCINFEWPGQKYGQNPYSKTSPFNQPLTWQGTLVAQRRDLSGQIYLRNRFYDPNTGRFTQEDPIGLAGGLNLYGFANGDPVNFSDPFGLFAGGPCDIPDLKCLSAAVMQRLVNRSVETLDAAPSAAGSAVGLGLPGPASTAVAQVTRNRAAGLLAEGKVARQVVAEGGQVLGRHVTAVTSSGRRVIDILAMAPNGGGLVALEVKSGGATVTFQQALKDLMMATEGARLVGRNAGPLAGQVVQIPTLIVRVP